MPLDLVQVAAALGVHEISLMPDLVEDGRLEQRSGTARILVSQRASVERRRYTIAHELGHLLLADPEGDVIARRMRSDDDVERFCDAFAAALLLPRELIRPYRRHTEQLSVLRDIAQQTRTSLAAVAVRLNELAGWSTALLHWRRDAGCWTYRWGAAVPTPVHRRLRSAPTTSVVLDELRAKGRHDQHAHVPMLVARRPVWLTGEFSARGPSAIGLVRCQDLTNG
jgi:hypothetical protein